MNPRKAFEQALALAKQARVKDVKGAEAYIRNIRNVGKKRFAEAWLKYCEGKSTEPEREEFGISVMGAQAVRLSLRDFGIDAPEDSATKLATAAIVMKFDSHAEMWDAIDVLEKNGMRIALSTKGGWTPGEHRPVSAWVDKRTTSLQFLDRGVADQAKKLLRQKAAGLASLPKPFITDWELKIFQDLQRPHQQRKIVSLGSLVIDRTLEAMDRKGWVKWVQVHPVMQSLSDDHYELTPQGTKLLENYAAWVKSLGKKL